MQEKSKPVRKSVLPTDEDETGGDGETKQKSVVPIQELSSGDLRDIIRMGSVELATRRPGRPLAE